MGVASYREDIYLRSLESNEQVPDAVFAGPPDEICPFCGSRFERHNALLEHLSEAHRGERPFLLLHGREPDQRYQLGYQLQKDRIIIVNSTSARLRINGRPPVDVPLKRLAQMLTKEVDSILELELENKFDASA